MKLFKVCVGNKTTGEPFQGQWRIFPRGDIRKTKWNQIKSPLWKRRVSRFAFILFYLFLYSLSLLTLRCTSTLCRRPVFNREFLWHCVFALWIDMFSYVCLRSCRDCLAYLNYSSFKIHRNKVKFWWQSHHGACSHFRKVTSQLHRIYRF